MTKDQLKTQIDTDITNKTTTRSISPLNVGNNMKDVVDIIPDVTDKESISNKSINIITDNASDIKYPSAKAVATYVDNLTAESYTNKSTNITADATSDVKYPSVKAVNDKLILKTDSGGSTKTTQDLDNEITGILANVRYVGDIHPSTDISGETGNIYADVVEAGTYTNWGGVVVPANTRALLKRVGGVFSSSMTTLDLSGKLNVSDVVDEISVVNEEKVPSVKSISNYVYRENLFLNNKFINPINIFTATPFDKDGFSFGEDYSLSFVESFNIFKYKGKCAKLDFTSMVNGGLIIAKSNFENLNSFNNTLAANVEIYTPVAVSGWYVFNQATGSSIVEKGITTSFSFSAGINVLQFPLTLFDADYDSIWLRLFITGGDWDGKTVYYGRTFLYSGDLDTTKRLDRTLYNEPYLEYDEIIKKSENLFIYNKFLDEIGAPNIDGFPVKTSFNFNTSIVSQTFGNAFPVFGYKGASVNLEFGDVTNGGLIILKSDFEGIQSYNNTIKANWEINTPVAISGLCKIFQGTSGSFVQKGGDISFSFSVGINVLIIPKITLDANYDNIWIRLFPSDNQWDNQTVKFGRLLMTSNEIEANQLESYIPEITRNIYNLSEKVKSAAPKSYWYNKTMVVLGDSITQMSMWQPEVVRAIGVNDVNRGLGGSTITPYITNETGKHVTESIYYRADAVNLDNPDLILLFGGQNDNLTAMGGDIPLGTISDATYTGTEVSSSPPSFYASYKGTVEKLLTQNPTAILKLITPLWSSDQTYALKKTKCDAIIEIGKLYGLEVINLLETVGINSINQTTYISDGVHPNSLGGEIIGALISNRLR